jgi:hypothetical protein
MVAAVALILAICEGCTPNGLLALGAGALICAMIAALVLMVRAAGDHSNDAMATFGAALIAGAIIATTPGLSDTGADYLARFLIGLAVGTGGGVAVALVRRRDPLLLAALGLLGGGAFLATGVLLLVLAAAVTGESVG